MQRSATYFHNPQIGASTPRDAEVLAFGLCNDRLSRADSPLARIEALHKTHQLWSLLVRDLNHPGNGLPPNLKQQLIALGFWAMVYSTRAIANVNMPLKPLIDLHRDMIEGLRAQYRPPATPPVTTLEAALSA
jgi:flagellar protein FlaF